MSKLTDHPEHKQRKVKRAIIPTNDKAIVQLVAETPLITMQQLVDQEFEAVAEFANFQTDVASVVAHEEKLRNIAIGSRFAITVLGRSKAELIDLVKSMVEQEDGESEIEALHKCLVDSRNLAEALTEMMMTAECRVAVAIANTAQP